MGPGLCKTRYLDVNGGPVGNTGPQGNDGILYDTQIDPNDDGDIPYMQLTR